MDVAKDQIHVADMVLFGATFFISTAVGVFFAWKDRNKQSTDQYYFGGGKISPVAVAASLSVSFVSAIAVIGQPVEVYLYGTVFAWFIVTQVSATVIASAYFLPVYHRLQLRTVYEYLELRFNNIVRKLCSILIMLNRILYLSIVIYVPSLALSSVTPLSLEWAIALTSLVCTFYTTLGGMKGVIWTDVFQAVIMVVGMLSVFIRSLLAVGGFDIVWSAIERGERNNFLKFDLDPRTRSSMWTIVFGIGSTTLCDTCCTQVYVQRYMCCRNVRMARTALFLALIPGIIFALLTIGNGLIMYTYYENCDPLLSGKIDKVDQSLISMAVEIFQSMPGMAGLFVSTVYCGTLSSVSSGINAMAALTLTDFIIPIFPMLTPRRKLAISKALSLAFGILAMVLAYLMASTRSNVIQVAYTVVGSVVGPVVGIFLMGVFTPWISTKGALVGVTTGFATALWIAASALFTTVELHLKTATTLRLSIENCTNSNTTSTPASSNTTTLAWVTTFAEGFDVPEASGIYQTLYSISPFYNGTVGVLMCIIAGHVASLITGLNKPSEADPRLFMPILNKRIFRFGVPELKKNNAHDQHGEELTSDPLK